VNGSRLGTGPTLATFSLFDMQYINSRKEDTAGECCNVRDDDLSRANSS